MTKRASRAPAILTALVVAALAAAGLVGGRNGCLFAKHKADAPDPNNPTFRLFQLLDSARDGKLEDFYLLGDLYKAPDKPDEEYRHVFRVNYDKGRGFGKLNLWVRSVAKMTPQQLETYTAKQIYDFGETDLEKYVKTNAGEFGTAGDVYLHANADTPLASAPVTDDVRKSYDLFVIQYLIPAFQKK